MLKTLRNTGGTNMNPDKELNHIRWVLYQNPIFL